MKQKFLACCAAILLSISAISAQEMESDPIEEALVECLDADENQDTAGMANCLQTAYDAYDAQLNETYGALLESLDEVSAELLRASQRMWISFRDAEFAWIDEGLYPPGGSMYTLFRMDDRIEFIRTRIRQLKMYNDTVSEFNEER